MEKIIGVLQRLLKNILNYNMDKSEKCYYAIIENKKRGKFSGASPIQVAKKVASKKLKAGKEIEFYLDEAGSKKKRYGPYYERKDKKTGKVAVVKGRKVMKGGVLSASDMEKLREFFYNYNDSLINPHEFKIPYFVELKLPWKSFFNEPIIFFDPSPQTIYIKKYFYRYAVFKESNGCIYIIKYEQDINFFKIINFTDFFINPLYSINFKNSSNNSRNNLLVKREILEKLINPENINSRTIHEEARKIYDLLFIPTNDITKQKVIIYVPNYSKPFVRKCVYPDLTFGILDEETRIRTLEFPRPESNQKFLILTNTGLSGMSINEPVIYVRNPFAINAIEVEELKQKIISEKNKYKSEIITNKNPNGNHLIEIEHELAQKLKLLVFDYWIYYSSNKNKLIIIGINYEEELIINNYKLLILNPIIFYILLGIPVEFGRFRRIKDISESILKYHNTKRELPFQLSSIINNISKKSNQAQLEKQITQLQQIIESLKLLEPKEPETQLHKAYRILNIFPELNTQLNQIQSLIQKLQPQQTLEQPQQTLEQQLSRLQKLLTDKLIEQKKLLYFTNNDIPTIQPFQNQLQQLLKRNQLTKLQQQILQRPESPQQERIEYLKTKQQQQQQPIFRNTEYSKQRQQELNLFRQQNNRETSLIQQLQKLPKYNNNKYLRQRQRELNLIKQPEMSLEKPKTLYRQQHYLQEIQENN